MSMGWVWLRLECILCSHKGELRFDEFRIIQARMELGRLLSRCHCSKCGGRQFSILLGTYLTGSGQPFPHYLPIEIRGTSIISAPR